MYQLKIVHLVGIINRCMLTQEYMKWKAFKKLLTVSLQHILSLENTNDPQYSRATITL